MKSKFMRALGALLVAAAAIAGCRPAEVIPPPEDSIPVQATADPQQSAYVTTIAAGDEVVFDLNVPGSVAAASEVYYVELDVDLPLELRRSSNYGVLVASSSSSAFFASGHGGVSGAALGDEAADLEAAVSGAGELDPHAIGVARVCGGSCVIRPVGDKLHARVRNTSGSAQQVTLYFFGEDLQDLGEAENDSRATAPDLDVADQGAIELIGDVDYFRAPSRRNVALTQNAGALPVQAVVVNASGVAVGGPYTSASGAFEVCEGYAVRVTATVSNRAAAPGTSLYTLTSTLLPPDPDCGEPTSVAISAGTDPDSPRYATTLAPGEALFLDMSIPGGVLSMPVVYFEIDEDLSLQLRNAANTSVIASSNSSDLFFAGGGSLQAAAAADLEPQGIAASLACRGSCVIFPASASAYVGLIVNEGAAPASLNVYLYGEDLMDTGEPGNDSRATAPTLGDNDAGAIETLGDVDHYWIEEGGIIDFATVAGIPIVAHVLDAAGQVVDGAAGGPFYSGDSLLVFSGEYIRVRAEDHGGVAAAAQRSSYFLTRAQTLSDAEVLELRQR